LLINERNSVFVGWKCHFADRYAFLYVRKQKIDGSGKMLTVTGMSQGFGDKVIFDDVSFKLSKGEHIGLVGNNGQGKSTFFKIITREILPDDGRIEWSSKANVGYMDQNVVLDHFPSVRDVLKSAFDNLFALESALTGIYDEMAVLQDKELEKAMNKAARFQTELEESDFYSIDSKIEGITLGLGVRDLLDKNPQKLSGGQRTKILLAKLLLEKPDILLLDEPTNHLDEENVTWLKEYLIGYTKAFILISHDTDFMNTVVDVIYHLENRKLTRYPGNYIKFQRIYKERKAQQLAAFAKQQVEISKLETYIQKNGARASTAGQAKSREKALDKMDRIQIDKKAPDPHFDFREATEPGNVIFEAKKLVIGYKQPLSRALNLSMDKYEKIAIIGANGIGKTTLLKSLMGVLSPVSGKVNLDDRLAIGYYEQEVPISTEETVLDNVWEAFPDLKLSDVRKLLARCGLKREHIENKIYLLSGGEQAKVRLCKIINKKTNVLFLDEPTNHLDVKAKKELKRALIHYKGSIVLVSHEVEFYKDIATKIWDGQDFVAGK